LNNYLNKEEKMIFSRVEYLPPNKIPEFTTGKREDFSFEITNDRWLSTDYALETEVWKAKTIARPLVVFEKKSVKGKDPVFSIDFNGCKIDFIKELTPDTARKVAETYLWFLARSNFDFHKTAETLNKNRKVLLENGRDDLSSFIESFFPKKLDH